jgi:hypothetical protein
MKTKTFDAVKMMRELRDRLGREMEGMTREERLRYVRDKAASARRGTPSTPDSRESGQPEEPPEEPSDSSGQQA